MSRRKNIAAQCFSTLVAQVGAVSTPSSRSASPSQPSLGINAILLALIRAVSASRHVSLALILHTGVSYSTPTISFFENDAERALWNAASPPLSLNASSDAIQQVWGRAQLQGQLAAQRDTSGILKYMTTDNTARDMLLITQKFGFEKLQYYGVSSVIVMFIPSVLTQKPFRYGSVLGATFAALFPVSLDTIVPFHG
jgi:hypothetical protein